MKITIRGLALVLVLALAALPLSAAAVQVFDFTGQAVLPSGVGGSLTMHSVVNDPFPLDTPVPLDFANYQYTLVITGLTLMTAGNPQLYAGGFLTIYEDAGTVADYGNLATFTDGTPILVGGITTLQKVMFGLSLGSLNGYLDWIGGTRLNDIAPQDQSNWAVNSGTNNRSSLLLPGFDEVWTGKVEPPYDIVGPESSTWGGVKALFK